MKKILIVLILFIFSFSSIAEESKFSDGKYFASVYSNTYNGDKPRWTVIINKTIVSKIMLVIKPLIIAKIIIVITGKENLLTWKK